MKVSDRLWPFGAFILQKESNKQRIPVQLSRQTMSYTVVGGG